MHPFDELLRLLREALGTGGNDAQISNAIALLERASTYPEHHLDTAVAANGPTYRQVAARALLSVANARLTAPDTAQR